MVPVLCHRHIQHGRKLGDPLAVGIAAAVAIGVNHGLGDELPYVGIFLLVLIEVLHEFKAEFPMTGGHGFKLAFELGVSITSGLFFSAFPLGLCVQLPLLVQIDFGSGLREVVFRLVGIFGLLNFLALAVPAVPVSNIVELDGLIPEESGTGSVLPIDLVKLRGKRGHLLGPLLYHGFVFLSIDGSGERVLPVLGADLGKQLVLDLRIVDLVQLCKVEQRCTALNGFLELLFVQFRKLYPASDGCLRESGHCRYILYRFAKIEHHLKALGFLIDRQI